MGEPTKEERKALKKARKKAARKEREEAEAAAAVQAEAAETPASSKKSKKKRKAEEAAAAAAAAATEGEPDGQPSATAPKVGAQRRIESSSGQAGRRDGRNAVELSVPCVSKRELGSASAKLGRIENMLPPVNLALAYEAVGVGGALHGVRERCGLMFRSTV